MNASHPFRIDERGRTATVDDEQHIRDLIEQVLFTAPGERVMRPTFGSGIYQLVFAPNSDALAAATQSTVHGALTQWLGDRVQVEAVEARAEDNVLHVEVRYLHLRTRQRRTVTLTRPV